MIKYPNGKTTTKKPKEDIIYKNRGMNFEEEINYSNEYYLKEDIAVIYKKPTPIKVVAMDSNDFNRYCITKAYYQQPSTTDYNGIYKGRYIDFEAKETTNKTSFPLSNIHEHQILHLANITRHGGIGFIIVNFKVLGEIYLLDIKHILQVIDSKRASIPHDVFVKDGILVPQGYVLLIDYIKAVDSYYMSKGENNNG